MNQQTLIHYENKTTTYNSLIGRNNNRQCTKRRKRIFKESTYQFRKD